jgi:hypothetical protein
MKLQNALFRKAYKEREGVLSFLPFAHKQNLSQKEYQKSPKKVATRILDIHRKTL